MRSNYIICLLLGLMSLCNNKVYSQIVSTYAGTGVSGNDDGLTNNATFSGLTDIVMDTNGNFYVSTDYFIRKIDATSLVVTTYAGTGMTGHGDGQRLSATFNGISNLAFDPSGNLIIVESGNNLIRKLDVNTGIVSTIAGTLAGTPGYVNGPALSAMFNRPRGVIVDASGNIFVADTENNAIRKISTSGTVSTFAGSLTGLYGGINGSGTSARLAYPCDIVIDASGDFYVTEWGGKTVRKITSSGVVSSFAGSYNNSGYENGTGSAARFDIPQYLTISPVGDFYVSDKFRIRKITPAGVVSSYAGSNIQQSGDVNGPAATAKFYTVRGLTFDASGNLYVTDQNNNKIKKIAPATPLSTSWISFYCNLNDERQVDVQWKVSEKGVDEFQIERSIDGIRFALAGKVKSVGDGVNSYKYTDDSELNGKGYYRIKMLDKLGNSSYSSIVIITPIQQSIDIRIQPNPFSTNLAIFAKSDQNFVLYNTQGKIIMTAQLHVGNNEFDVSSLVSGMYFIKTANGQMKTIIKR